MRKRELAGVLFGGMVRIFGDGFGNWFVFQHWGCWLILAPLAFFGLLGMIRIIRLFLVSKQVAF